MRRLSLHTFLFNLAILSLSASVYAQAHPQNGHARIYIKSEDGHYVANARVYVFESQNRKVSYAESSSLGAVSVELPPGSYTVSASITLPVMDAIDRFTSPEAHIEILPQDTTSVVLTLHPIVQADELSKATLEKIGVADEVAQYQRLN